MWAAYVYKYNSHLFFFFIIALSINLVFTYHRLFFVLLTYTLLLFSVLFAFIKIKL